MRLDQAAGQRVARMPFRRVSRPAPSTALPIDHYVLPCGSVVCSWNPSITPELECGVLKGPGRRVL
jgi:hypothetical protein